MTVTIDIDRLIAAAIDGPCQKTREEIESTVRQCLTRAIAEAEMDLQSGHPTGTPGTALSADEVREQLRQLGEKIGKSPDRQYLQWAPLQSGISQLRGLFEVLQAEEGGHQHEPTISISAVENRIAQCIAGCLAGEHGQSPDTAHILALLADNRVVLPLRDGRVSVSLHRVHVTVQDNFSGSCLCGLLDVLMAGHMGTATKVVAI
jgi:hypothetical protein